MLPKPRCRSSTLSGSASRRALPLPETCGPTLPLPGSGGPMLCRATTGAPARPNPSSVAQRHHARVGFPVASPGHRAIVVGFCHRCVRLHGARSNQRPSRRGSPCASAVSFLPCTPFAVPDHSDHLFSSMVQWFTCG